MSEDASTKAGNRRRRTTRAGRRRGLRVPSERIAQGSEERWSPAWTSEPPPASSEPETLPGEALEEIEAEAEVEANAKAGAGEEDIDSRVTTPTRDAVMARAGVDEDEAEPDTIPPPAADDDRRATAEILVTPINLSQLQDEEKTNPRIRVSELKAEPTPGGPSAAGDRPSASWKRLGNAIADGEQDESLQVSRPSVVIAPARIISDRPPPMRRARPAERAPIVETNAEALAAEPRAQASEAMQARAVPEAAPPRVEPAEPAAPPAAVAPAADPVVEAEPAPAPRQAEAVAAPSTTANAPASVESAAEDGGLQIVDVDVAELEARRSPTPPPPPPKAAAPKRPPPPPAKTEDDRSKRKQVRQWWERFFSDDYLMSVLPTTPAQIAKQVDFIEQSLGVAKGGTILDVGCGLGLHSVELSRRGYLVVGLDLSLAMITRAAEYAQHEQLKLNVVHADIREMEFDGAFDGIICWGTTFGFFDEEANRDVLARLHHALRPGGRVLLDTVNRDYVVRFQPNLVWFEGDECVCMEESDFNYFSSRLTVKRTIMREDGRQSQAEYSVRLYSLHELGQLMQQVGFRVIEVSGQEAIRGTFFGGNSPRVLMLSERRTAGRATAVPPERGSMEIGRASMAMPVERGSAEVPKIPKPE